MARLMGLLAIVLGVSLLVWVGVATVIGHPLVHDQTPLKPILFSFVMLSAGIGWMSHGDDEAESEA